MSRKDDHVNHALDQFAGRRKPAEGQKGQPGRTDFDDVSFVHHSLRSIDVSSVDLSTRIGRLELHTPFFINAMTGGTEWTRSINEKLAEVARRTGLAMAVGSMSAAMKDESLLDTFTVVREINPDGIVFANLNPNYSSRDALYAIEKMKADAIQIHVNAPQEIVMGEGDRSFSHWSENIRSIAESSPVDVIVKEVGFGMSRETIAELISLGSGIIDVSGKGGTNFAKIESDRHEDRKMAYLNDWGLSTVQSLLEAHEYRDTADLIASGGIRHPLDFAKAYALGARAVGMSGPFLSAVMNEGVEATIQMVEEWKQELRLIMALAGSSTVLGLRNSDLVLSAELLHYCVQRDIRMARAED